MEERQFQHYLNMGEKSSIILQDSVKMLSKPGQMCSAGRRLFTFLELLIKGVVTDYEITG